MSRNFDFSQAASKGVTVLPDLSTGLPNVGDVASVKSVSPGQVFLGFSAAGTGGGGAGYLALSGGTMTGPLVLAADPLTNLQASTKQYVDATVAPVQTLAASASTTANNAVKRSGDTMTGALTLYADPTTAMQAATKEYVDGKISASGGGTVMSITAGAGLSGGVITTTGTIAAIFGTTSGTLVEGNDTRLTSIPLPATVAPPMDGNPVPGISLSYARQDHVHASDTSRLSLSGGTMTGVLTLASDPASSLQAATKQYVDTSISANTSAVTVSDTPPSAPKPGSLWWDSLGGQLYIQFQDQNSSQFVVANSGGIAEAPVDTNLYARTNQTWSSITASVAAAPNSTGRNLLHNPMFTVAQRGSGPWTTNASYTLDRWIVLLVNDTVSVSIAPFSDAGRAAIGDETATQALQVTFTGSSTAGSLNLITQRIEGVRRLGGKQITVSFWASASVGTPRVAVSYSQNFGAGGSPSAAVAGNFGVTPALSSTWTRYVVTGTLPSTAGKTLGTAGDFTAIQFILSDQANTTGIGVQSGTVAFWGVQAEYGNVATSLAKRDPADEIALCQRFYVYVPYNFSGYNVAGGTSAVQYPMFAQMRAAPTITNNVSGSTNVTLGSSNVTGGATYTTISVVATAAGGFWYSGNFSASADL